MIEKNAMPKFIPLIRFNFGNFVVILFLSQHCGDLLCCVRAFCCTFPNQMNEEMKMSCRQFWCIVCVCVFCGRSLHISHTLSSRHTWSTIIRNRQYILDICNSPILVDYWLLAHRLHQPWCSVAIYYCNCSNLSSTAFAVHLLAPEWATFHDVNNNNTNNKSP